MDLVFDTVKSFKSTFKNLNNIYKFTDAHCMQKVE